MRITDLLHPQYCILYEVPDPAGGGGAAGAVSDPNAQPAPGQGDGTTPQADQFWGLFPDVPEDQRPVLEPHLKNVQGHVTQLQQQYAPFKPFVDRGYSAEQMNGLYQFSENFDRDPLKTWLDIGALLQQPDPTTGKPLVSEDLDLEILYKIATGQEIDDDQDPAQTAGQLPGGANQTPEVAQLMQTIQGLQSKIEAFESERNNEKVQTQQRTQERLLKTAMGNVRAKLKEAGYTDEQLQKHVTDAAVRSAILTSNGNADKAAQMFVDLRSGILSGIVDTGGQPKPLDTSGGVPQPKTTPSPRQPRDGFEAARGGAQDFLRRQNRSAAQG